MSETIGELVTGEKTELQKYFTPEEDDDEEVGGKNHWWTDCDGVIYGDTDSCYFKTYATNKEEAVTVADFVAEQVNASFPPFAEKFFNVFGGREQLLKAAREIVGIRGLWLNAKKKYTIRVVDSEGKAVDKLKSMGSEIKKADTPKVIQEFLKGLMNLVLNGDKYEAVETFVNSKRGELIRKVKNVIDLGVAKQVNNLDALYAEWKKTEKVGKGKVKLSGHVRAAVNYNEMVVHFAATDKLLRSGDKAITLYLMPNQFGFKSMAFPADMMHLPEWFTENFRVDKKITEEKMIDNKLKRIFEALNWDIPTPQKTMIKSILKF